MISISKAEHLLSPLFLSFFFSVVIFEFTGRKKIAFLAFFIQMAAIFAKWRFKISNWIYLNLYSIHT